MLNRPDIRAVTGKVFGLMTLTGGDINEVVRVSAAKGEFVLKSNRNPRPGLFASEARGLALLGKNGLKVPEVYLVGEEFLLMEYFAPGAPQPGRAGEMLARLHSQAQSDYGFDSPTYLATLLQDNRPAASWADFHATMRIDPLVRAIGVDSADELRRWRKFHGAVKALLDSCPQSSLLHGDLWAGNLHYSNMGPVFLDPAVYRGDALVDIAMTRLFGAFGLGFYEAYFANTQRRTGTEEYVQVYQVYPLLVHAKLFDSPGATAGGGYYRSAAGIRDRFI